MISSWIRDLLDVYADGGEWEDYLPTLEHIDALLRQAMSGTDNESLYDDIAKEVEQV